ncbi:hypothetical protein M433DRAFT_272393 [Acidomyces richmondensis BFW]|nr:MAG: hypothetical protein FE78DRAFT_424549 [Acidomyces sp. 'richmondensis']KYG45065.1 hypothetical protein M433DRAFT_272393 [Acidomyces richmondensis BFW]
MLIFVIPDFNIERLIFIAYEQPGLIAEYDSNTYTKVSQVQKKTTSSLAAISNLAFSTIGLCLNSISGAWLVFFLLVSLLRFLCASLTSSDHIIFALHPVVALIESPVNSLWFCLDNSISS